MSDQDLSGLPPVQPDEPGDLADHEAAFGPNGTGEVPDSGGGAVESGEKAAESGTDTAESGGGTADTSAPRDDQGRFQKTPRHRAKSQQASPGDVPRIQELTAKLRAAEAERDALKQRPVSPPQQAPMQPRQEPAPAQPAAQWTPTRPEPSEDEVGTKYATYAAFTRDQALWVHEQERAKDRAEAQQAQQAKTYRDWTTQYQTKRAEFVAKTPDFDAVVSAADQQVQALGLQVPQVLVDAILSSERGPEVAHWLATNPTDYHDLIRDAWSVNQFSSVGMVRRVLESRLPVASAQRLTPRSAAGVTGAAPPLSIVPAPRPPTPVRTGPLKSGDDPPDEDDGLEAHEAFFNKRR